MRLFSRSTASGGLCLLLHLSIAAQRPNPNSPFKISDDFYSPRTFTIFANRTFGQLATGQHTASLANFGSFDPAKGSFDFNAFTPLSFSSDEGKHMVPYLSLAMKGDLASDNTLKLFSDSKLNTNVDGIINLHIPLPFLNSIGYYASESNILRIKKIALQAEYDIRLLEADTTGTSDSVRRALSGARLDEIRWYLHQQRDTLTILDSNIAQLRRAPSPDTVQIAKQYGYRLKASDRIFQLHRDSVKTQIEYDQLDSLTRLSPARRRNYTRQTLRILRESFSDSLTKLELAAPISAVRLSWFTLTGNFNRKKYHTYDTTRVFNDRIDVKRFNAFNFGVEWHLYFQQRYRSMAHYLKIGYSHRKNNNIKDLSTSELTQKTKTSANGVEREVLDRYSAYTDSIQEFKSNFFYADYYFMFKRNALSALHFFPEFDVRRTGEQVFNAGIGYVISFKDSKKEKAVINAEAYYKFLDLSNELGSAQGIWERNEIGIRVGLPLNFIIQK